MKLELICNDSCPFAQRTEILLKLGGINYKKKYIDLSNKPEWFKELSPFNKIPVLTANKIPIFESNVINSFLNQAFKLNLNPKNIIEAFSNKSWMEFCDELHKDMFKWASAPSNSYSEIESDMFKKLEILNKKVKGKFFNGDNLNLIDITFAPFLIRLDFIDSHFSSPFLRDFPKIRAWIESILSDEYIFDTFNDELESKFIKKIISLNKHMASLLS